MADQACLRPLGSLAIAEDCIFQLKRCQIGSVIFTIFGKEVMETLKPSEYQQTSFTIQREYLCLLLGSGVICPFL
jgi:hypothetical protein